MHQTSCCSPVVPSEGRHLLQDKDQGFQANPNWCSPWLFKLWWLTAECIHTLLTRVRLGISLTGQYCTQTWHAPFLSGRLDIFWGSRKGQAVPPLNASAELRLRQPLSGVLGVAVWLNGEYGPKSRLELHWTGSAGIPRACNTWSMCFPLQKIDLHQQLPLKRKLLVCKMVSYQQQD